jgi:hypothetical protein
MKSNYSSTHNFHREAEQSFSPDERELVIRCIDRFKSMYK